MGRKLGATPRFGKAVTKVTGPNLKPWFQPRFQSKGPDQGPGHARIQGAKMATRLLQTYQAAGL
jgi:hypothetical protein